MKKIYSKLHIACLLLLAVFMTACEKDGDEIYLRGFEASDLMASTTDVVITQDKSDAIVLSLAWKNPTLLSSDSEKTAPNGVLTTYLQVSATEDFASYSENTVTQVSKAYTGDELNSLSKELGCTPEVSAPLYFRIKSTEGSNIEPAYSNVCKVNVTPFRIYMNTLSVLSSDKSRTIATLYSPEEDGVYTGYMYATSWLNCWFKENNGTVWGNYPVDGTPYQLANTQDAWNCWFAGVTGFWYVTVDANNKEWKGFVINSMTVNGEAMTFDTSDNTWKAVITTTSANTAVSIVANGATYDKETKTDDAAAIATTQHYTLNDGKMTHSDASGAATIATAGTYTVAVKIGENGALEYTITEGDTSTPEVEASNTLCMFTTDGSTLLAVMTKVSDGVYQCSYKPYAWENFKFIFVGENKDDKQTWYGCDPSGQFILSSASDCWNIWFNDEDGITEKTVTANLNTMTWSYE